MTFSLLDRIRHEGFDMARPISDADGLSLRQRARLMDMAPPKRPHGPTEGAHLRPSRRPEIFEINR